MPQSPELAGGAGYTFEDLVAARYLAALLCESAAPGAEGAIISAVALQQRDFGEPLDDVIVDFRRQDAQTARLSLQVKRSLIISSAATNRDFREIIRDSLSTLRKADFREGIDRFGAAVGTVASGTFRDLTTLCELARASETVAHFEARFAEGGNASVDQRAVRDDVATLLSEQFGAPYPGDLVHRFLKHFSLVHVDYLHQGATDSSAAVDSVRAALADADSGEAPKLWDSLCRIAREGAGRSQQFSRASLVRLVLRTFRLRGAPSLRTDLAKLEHLARSWVLDIDDDVHGTRLHRPELVAQLDELLTRDRFVQVRGLPGSGKSVLLRGRIEADLVRGPVLFLKSDRLEGRSWSSFATPLGLAGTNLVDLLVELEAVGTNVLYVDGIDRVEKQHQPVVSDVVRAIIREPVLANWHVVISLRDAGAEPLRTWLPDLFESGGIGTVDVQQLNDNEALELSKAQPELARLLFGAPAVREIVRRPFFAKILSQGLAARGGDSTFAPRSEVDLIENWWSRGGFNAFGSAITRRQRAIVELGAKRARNLSQPIAMAELSQPTVEVIDELVNDGLLQTIRAGHSVRFAHDIFFEWAFFHRLVDCGTAWPDEIRAAGEPPVIGRVVELVSQSEFMAGESWPTTLATIDGSGMRSQWTRAWLLGPLSTPTFDDNQARFYDICAADGFRVLQKVLVWFQAEKTVPNPAILDGRRGDPNMARDEIIRVADLLGWPSDFEAWRRLLVLVLDRLDAIPASLIPDVVVLFEVWQNALADYPNTISTRAVTRCAAWLSDIERRRHSRGRREDETPSPWSGLGSDLKDLEQSLRRLVLRAARLMPVLVASYLSELGGDVDRLNEVFQELIGFAPILAQSHATILGGLTILHLKEELPQVRLDREQEQRRRSAERRRAARAKPAGERTRREEMELMGSMSILGSSFNSFEWNNLAVDKHQTNYFPASPLREPFPSLFGSASAEALRLLRDLTNHAMTAWRQLHRIDPQRRATPIPIELQFPWGTQTFWGTRREYLWHRGLWAPKPLASAYLALENWAFKQLEAGRAADELIEEVVKGNDSVAILGTAVSLMLQSWTVSEVTLPLVTCQRLWRADLERVSQEASIASSGLIGFTEPRTDRPHAVAVDALNKRPVRKHWLRELVPSFVLSPDRALAGRARLLIAGFEGDLPFEYEEQRGNDNLKAALLNGAKFNAEFAKLENYQTIAEPQTNGEEAIVLKNPQAETPENVATIAQSNERLQENLLWSWANQSLEASELSPTVPTMSAVGFGKRIDTGDLFKATGSDGFEIGMRRGAVAGVAAVVLKYRQQFEAADIEWARAVVDRATTTPEERDTMWSSDAVIPWHPCISVARAMAFEIQSGDDKPQTRRQLLRLVSHPLNVVSLAAIKQAFSLWELEPRLAWCALWQGLALCQFEVNSSEAGARIFDPAFIARERTAKADKAIAHLEKADSWPDLPAMPPAWVPAETSEVGEAEELEELEEDGEEPTRARRRWRQPDMVWDSNFAQKVLGIVRYREIIGRSETRQRFMSFCKELLDWVIQKIAPPWKRPKQRERGQNFFELDSEVGRMFAMMAGEFDTQTINQIFFVPVFALENEHCFALLSPFVNIYVCNNILDAPTIPENGVEILRLCLERILKDPVFDVANYRAGELHGWYLPSLTRSLLFVAVEQAALASRFANGDWREIGVILPVVDRFVRAAGWSSAVMNDFLTLCERSRDAYPADLFADQILTVLAFGPTGLKGWRGSLLPARIAGLVQHFAFRETPMGSELGQKLLRILDILVDMGDRRSAALQISDSFREVKAA